MNTKWRLYHQDEVGKGRNLYHNFKIVAFLRALPLLWSGWRVRITDNAPRARR